jgi:hypothetical protein
MEELCLFDLHGRLKTPRMDTIPHRMGRGPMRHWTPEMIDIAFGGSWTTLGDDIIAPYTWTLGFGGPRCHLPSLDVMWRIGFDGLDGFRREMMWFEGRRCIARHSNT